MTPRLVALAGLVLVLCQPLGAQVVRIKIDRREPFAEGHPFGSAGAYEKLEGSLYLEADPNTAGNRRVADLRLAPRNRAGKVEYRTDFFLLKPVDPSKGNHRLFYDVNNRGNKIAMGTFNDHGGLDPSTLADAGNGFLMRQGYSVLWTGWSGDVVPGDHRMAIDLPVAMDHGKPVTGKVYAEIEVGVIQLYERNVGGGGTAVDPTRTMASAPLVWANSKGYPAADLDPGTATLTKRERRSDPAIAIPPEQWSFSRLESDRVIPDASHVLLKEGFRPGWLYDLVYVGRDARVVGLGLAGVRDAISFFRYESRDRTGTPNPLAGAIQRAYGYGGSQSGRFLNHFVWAGFNGDGQGRIVFDGVVAHVPGSGKGLFNSRFAQTTRHGSHHEENLYPSDFFPFTSTPEVDPVTGQRGDVLELARAAHVVPKIFYVQTSTEYWSRAASLLHTDVEGKRDVPLDPNVRIYLETGAAHNAMTGGAYAHEVNRLDSRPLSRALLVALDRWAGAGVSPPESRYPRIADGTLVDLARFRASFPKIPGAKLPEGYYAPLRLDPGPRWQTLGIADNVPPKVGPPYRTLVPAVDSTGNDIAGIRLPDVAVPLATYAGWNLRAAAWGAEGMLTRWMGSSWPLPRTAEERAATGDSRRSVRERYPTQADYVARVRQAALELVRQRFLLDEDVAPIVTRAEQVTVWKD
jgi:hypothetical protein